MPNACHSWETELQLVLTGELHKNFLMPSYVFSFLGGKFQSALTYTVTNHKDIFPFIKNCVLHTNVFEVVSHAEGFI